MLRPPPAGRVRPIRIVVVDDQWPMTELMEFILGNLFAGAKIMTFQNRDRAWEELLRADPDLLITDMNNQNMPDQPEYSGMSGGELLPLLARRKVKYPILVVSGSVSKPGEKRRARKCAGPNLNITFLAKPGVIEEFQREVKRLLSDDGMC